MKEYIKFSQGNIFVRSKIGERQKRSYWTIHFYKLSNFSIWHRENDKPAVIDSDGTFINVIQNKWEKLYKVNH